MTAEDSGKAAPTITLSLWPISLHAAGLLSELDIAEIDVIGISFGGMVAQHLAIRHPKLIRKLVLACTSPGKKSHLSVVTFCNLMDLPPEERQKHV